MDIAAALPPATPSFSPSRFSGGSAIPAMPTMAPASGPTQQAQQPLISPDALSKLTTAIQNSNTPQSVAVTPQVTANGGFMGGTGNSGALGVQGNGGLLGLIQGLFSGGGN